MQVKSGKRIRRFRLVLTAACLVVVTALLGLYLAFWPHRGEIIERWEASNGIYTIRLTSYQEAGLGFVLGAYYVFESRPIGSRKWKEIMTVYRDDPDPLPRENVRFVNGGKVAYVFLGNQYAGTVDGGETWFVWNIFDQLPGHRAAILDVKLTPDGRGKMFLQDFTGKPPINQLHTKNHGRDWSAEE